MDAQESQLFIAIIIAVIAIGGIIAYFIFSVFQHQKKMLMLERQNANAEITALEKDRSRIANDLHDDLAPMLSAVKMKINSFELNELEDQTQLDKTNDTIDEIAKRMRAISFDLMPGSLKVKGLNTAIHEFANFISKKDSLFINVDFPQEELVHDEQKAIHMYRIVQELIQNTLKHAKATQLLIELKREKHNLVLTSRDNGVGFNYDAELQENMGFGLRSLLNRTTLLNGNLDIQSKLGSGTIYIIEIPL
jgi:signal transduction histidine kinase